MADPDNQTQNQNSGHSSGVSMAGSEGLWEWLKMLDISLAFTTYQTNRLFLLGRKPEGRLGVNERLFDKPMGLYRCGNSLYMACRYQLWQLENRLGEGETLDGYDRLYVPSIAYTTGDVNVHDVVVTVEEKPVFVNTDFSCLAALKPGYSFESLWQPFFISKLAAEDRCHLNGLAMKEGKPAYATACSLTDHAAGWRDRRRDGGIVIDIPANELYAQGLSMPHSPRWYRGRLWLLNSGAGEFGYIADGRFEPVTFCPGFVRGLAFAEHYAIVGLSKLRSKTFAGLLLETRLEAEGIPSECGLRIIDLNSGAVVHSLVIEGVVEELFDIAVLPRVRLPKAVGLQNDDIGRLINFPGSGGLVTTKPTVLRPGIGKTAPVAGIPNPSRHPGLALGLVKYQQVFHLNPHNLKAYEGMTYPSLQARWQTHPQRGELLAVSASIEGVMVGLAVAERFSQAETEPSAELISQYVLPEYRRRGIGSALVKHLKKQFGVCLLP